jgi:hypothetical protein
MESANIILIYYSEDCRDTCQKTEILGKKYVQRSYRWYMSKGFHDQVFILKKKETKRQVGRLLFSLQNYNQHIVKSSINKFVWVNQMNRYLFE